LILSIRLIGELAEWICHHPDYLERILEWLVVGLSNPRTASETANALQNVCSQCQDHMVRHLGGLIQILSSLDNLGLKPAAATGLIKGVALILSKMAHEDISKAMKDICSLQLTPIQTLVQKQRVALDNSSGALENGKICKNTPNDPVLYLDRLAAILRHVNPPNMSPNITHPCSCTVIEEIWPVVSAVCDVYASDARIMERTCRTIRFAVRCLGVQSAPLLEHLVKQMVSLYQRQPHSCFLYLGSILVDEYAHLGGNYVDGLLQMLSAFLPPTFVLLIPQDSGGAIPQVSKHTSISLWGGGGGFSNIFDPVCMK
jgi:transportin-3